MAERKGRPPGPGEHGTGAVLSVRRLTADEVSKAHSRVLPLIELKSKHHMIAKLGAQGYSNREIASNLGCTAQSVQMLRKAPSVMELEAEFRSDRLGRVTQFDEEVTAALVQVKLGAICEIKDRLERDPDSFTTANLIKVIEMTADRTGHGKTTTVTLKNGDLAQQLELGQMRAQKMLELRADIAKPIDRPHPDLSVVLQVTESPLVPEQAPVFERRGSGEGLSLGAPPRPPINIGKWRRI